MKYPLLLLILFAAKTALGQNIIQDNKGKTSLSLDQGKSKAAPADSGSESIDLGFGTIGLNTSAKKLDLSYYQYMNPLNPSFIGVSASGQIENSIGSVFSTGDLATGASLQVKFGKRLFSVGMIDVDEWRANFVATHGHGPTDADYAVMVNAQRPAADLWLVMNAAFTGSKFKLYYPDSAYAAQVKSKTFSSPEFHAGFNYWAADLFKAKVTVLAGATIGVKKANNFDDLTETTSQEVISGSSGTSTRKLTSNSTVYTGTYKETTSYPLNIDLYFKPHGFKNAAILLYDHTEYFKDAKSKVKLGAGLYLLRKNDLFNPVFGINIDYSDVAGHYLTDEKKGFSRISIGLVTNLSTLLFQQKSAN